MKIARIKYKLIVVAVVATVAQAMAPMLLNINYAQAAPQFTQAWVRLDRHKELTATGGTVCATPSADTLSATETEVKVIFPTRTGGTDFVVNTTAANWTVTTTNLPTGATAWPGIGTATNVTGKAVTFPSGDLTDDTDQYCFNFSGTNTLTNGQAGQSSTIEDAELHTLDSGSAVINDTNWSTALIGDDQILVTAVVPPNFSLTLSANADPFQSNLDPGNIISTTGINVSITTNAVGGWIAWVKDTVGVVPPDGGLTSTIANYTIKSGLRNATNTGPEPNTAVGDPAFDLIAGREGYVMDVDIVTDATAGCTVAIDAAYNYTGGGQGGGTISPNFRPISACTRTLPDAGTSDGDVIKLTEKATIRGGTPAGSDYADIITVVGAGNF